MNRTYTRAEQVVAWGGLAVVIAATVAVMWITLGAVAGLFTLSAYAVVLSWCAATDNLIRKD